MEFFHKPRNLAMSPFGSHDLVEPKREVRVRVDLSVKGLAGFDPNTPTLA